MYDVCSSQHSNACYIVPNTYNIQGAANTPGGGGGGGTRCAKWGLAHDYPMVAPVYAALRREIAKDIGLGRKRKS